MSNPVVYVITVDDVPRYYGSGTVRRSQSHMKTAVRFAKILAEGEVGLRPRQALYLPLIAAMLVSKVEVKVLKECESYDEARNLERKLIKEAGIDTLWNIRAGGIGLTSPKARRLNNRDAVIKRNKTSLKAWWADPANKARMKKSRKASMELRRKDPEAWDKFVKACRTGAQNQWARGDGWSQK